MKAFISLLKQRETMLGISAAIAFQLIFVFVWLTGYEGVFDRTDQLIVGIINEDMEIGNEIANRLEDNDLFEATVFTDVSKGKTALDERTIQMLIHLPSNITENILAKSNSTIDYYINQSTPTLTKEIMDKMASEINEQINLSVQGQFKASTLDEIPKALATQLGDEEIAKQIVEMIQEDNQIPIVERNINKTNNKDGFVLTMVPLLIVLASYIGAMLVSQHLQFSEAKLINQYRRTSLFTGRQIINILVALVVSLVTVCLLALFNVDIDHNFFAIWGFQAILMFSFLALSQVFVILFGNIGMVFNIALTATQLVSSGAIVPRELLPSFYQSLGSILPATYGVNGYLSLIYGGGNLASDMKYLSMIIGALLIIAIGGKLTSNLWIDKNILNGINFN